MPNAACAEFNCINHTRKPYKTKKFLRLFGVGDRMKSISACGRKGIANTDETSVKGV